MILFDSLTRATSQWPLLPFSIVVCATGILSILILAFRTDAINASPNRTGPGDFGDVMLSEIGTNDSPYLGLYPQYLFVGTIKITLAAAGTSLSVAVILGSLGIFTCRRAKALKLSKRERFAGLLLLAINTILSLAVIVICAFYHFRSGKFDPSYRSPHSQFPSFGTYGNYDGAMFDLGSWSCQVHDLDMFKDYRDVLSRQCIDETAGLWTEFLLVLSNLALTTLVWKDSTGKQRLIRAVERYDDEDSDDDYT